MCTRHPEEAKTIQRKVRERMYEMDLLDNTENINRLLARYGVKFGIYKNNTFREQLFPFDAIPRVIQREEFDYLEKGLKQRVVALNLFLDDIYHDKKIVKDKVIPEDFIFASSGYMPECEGVTPVKKIYSHISGIDLVKGKNDKWYILEDNLRVPSGASYPMIARELCRRSSPKTFRDNQLEDNRNYAQLLRRTLDNVNVEGHTVILTPGRYNAAYFEHSYLAEKTGSHLVNGSELVVENDRLYYVDYKGKRERVGAVYRRISDEYLDPMHFNPESVIGIPHIFDVYRKGNIALFNAHRDHRKAIPEKIGVYRQLQGRKNGFCQRYANAEFKCWQNKRARMRAFLFCGFSHYFVKCVCCLLLHLLRVMYISVKRSLNRCMPQPFLYSFWRDAGFDQHSCMGMPQ